MTVLAPGLLPTNSRRKSENCILWFWLENDGNGNFIPHIVSSQIKGSTSIFPVDLNGDGNMDIVSATMYDNTINWYKNNGNANFQIRLSL